MTHLKVNCECGGTVCCDESKDFNDPRFRTCPICGKQIDEQTWKHFVLPAFGSASDANRELEKDCSGYGLPKFSIEFEHSELYGNANGKVYYTNAEKEYGFIKPFDTRLNDNIYFRFSALTGNKKEVNSGDLVRYSELVPKQKGIRSYSVTVI